MESLPGSDATGEGKPEIVIKEFCDKVNEVSSKSNSSFTSKSSSESQIQTDSKPVTEYGSKDGSHLRDRDVSS